MMFKHIARTLMSLAVVWLAMTSALSGAYAQASPQDGLSDPVIEEPLRPLYPEDGVDSGVAVPTRCGGISPEMLAVCLFLLPGLTCMRRTCLTSAPGATSSPH